MYQKEVKCTDLSCSNHNDLKCCHCFSHHKTVGVTGSRGDLWFLLPHLRAHDTQCTQVTLTACWVGGRRCSLNFLVPGRRRFSVFLSLRLCCLGCSNVCVLIESDCFSSLSLDDDDNHLYCPLVPACEGAQDWVSVVLGKAGLKLACQAPAV